MHQPISSLNLPDFKVQELHSAGYRFCKDVDPTEENFNSKLSITEWKKLTELPKTKTALDIYQEECMCGSILTSNRQLDEVLGGGIPVGRITEFCGEPGSGKTQMCYHLCVNVQLPVWCGGMAGEAIYIGTNKGFASHRLREIATACVANYISYKTKRSSIADDSDKQFNVETILRKIHYIGIDNHVELLAVLKYMEKWLEKHASVRLIVVDTISAPLKTVTFQDRTSLIYSVFSDLQKLSEKYRFAIVLTNDITTRIQSGSNTYHTPSLGGSYYHRINVRVQLAKTSQNKFSATIVKNVLRPPVTVEFNLFS